MNGSVNIKLAGQKDLRAILDLVRDYERYDVEFARRYYELYFSNNKITEKDQVYVARLNEKIIGVIGFSRDYFSSDYSYWLSWFVVDKKYRGEKEKGLNVAKKLLKKVETELKKRKINKLFVSTEDTNRQAKSFYAKNKFRTEAVLRDYYYKGEDQLVLSKMLNER